MSEKTEKKATPTLVLVQYTLPTGATAVARKPNNGDRRALMDAPEFNQRYLMEVLSATCLHKIIYPKGHEKWPEGMTLEFDVADKKDTWARLDDLDLEDSISYVEAFGANNWPAEAMIKQVVESSKAKK